MKKSLLCSALTVLSFHTLHAQIPGEQLYHYYTNPPKVYAEAGREMPFAWCGGFNRPQVATADLNKDGIKDLVLFDPKAGARTFLNKSSTIGSPKYVYSPEYQAGFPEVYGYMKIEDYNRDAIPDLIHRGYEGITILRGYYDDAQHLTFNPNTRFQGFTGLRYLTGGSGMVNCYVAPNDLPGAADIDNDGDLDFISYNVWGTNIDFYRNCQIEDGLPKDSIRICVADICWGKTSQLYERKWQLGVNCGTYGVTCKGCDEPDAKTTHAGNTLTLVDFDNDGDKDLLNGNISFSDIQYGVNGWKKPGHVRDSIISEDTLWGANGKTLYMPQMPAAYWVDLDNNGSKDLAFAPYAENTENYKCLGWYKNTGTTSSPNFVYQSDTLFMQDMIDLGTGSAPVFYDYNKDGKPDLFISSEGYYQASNGSMHAYIHYYENTSTAGDPSFTLKNRDFMGLGSANLASAMLSMGDLNDDGKDDLVIGLADGTIRYFKNNAATAAMQPIWQSPLTLNDQFGTLDVGDFAAPCIYDINKDGKKDLVVGCMTGRLFYYKNLGSNTFNRITDTLGKIFLFENEGFFTHLAPFIGKVDNTSKEYLMLGSKNGMIYRYDNFQNGNTTNTYTRVDSFYSKINVRSMAKPTFADIDGDGKIEMAVGSTVGGVTLYKQYFNVGINDTQFDENNVKIYPNPAKDMINIGWLPSFASGDVYISLISVTGQKLYNATVPGSDTNASIDVSALPSGTYYCIVRSAEHKASSPVSIIR